MRKTTWVESPISEVSRLFPDNPQKTSIAFDLQSRTGRSTITVNLSVEDVRKLAIKAGLLQAEGGR